jgi:O-methyltransferase
MAWDGGRDGPRDLRRQTTKQGIFPSIAPGARGSPRLVDEDRRHWVTLKYGIGVPAWKRSVLQAAAQLPRLNGALARLQVEIRPIGAPYEQTPTIDFPTAWQRTIEQVAPYTMVSAERTGGLIQAIEHVIARGIPGAVVECGVWRGGSSMAAALTMQRLGECRDVYLFDTFEGMPRPTDADVDYAGRAELPTWDPVNRNTRVDIDSVRAAMRSTGYPDEHTSLVKGSVEDTVPEAAPQEIAVLRLDTDWYESTRHELHHLYPRLSQGGVLIIDDYGHYAGARKAVDEYLGEATFLHRLDYTGRLVVKS